MTTLDPARLEELERAVALAPGDPDFPVLAELLRRAGRHDEAEQVVMRGLLEEPESLPGRCVLLLILADTGRQGQQRGRLEAWVEEAVSQRFPADASDPVWPAEPEASDDPLSDAEFENAFSSAEPELDRMVTPDSVAEEAALRVDDGLGLQGDAEERPAFATHTMAELLERQGDHAGAARIRASLAAGQLPEPESVREPEVAPEVDSEAVSNWKPETKTSQARSSRLATLERWLDKARRQHP